MVYFCCAVGGLIAAFGIHKDGKHKEIRGRAMWEAHGKLYEIDEVSKKETSNDKVRPDQVPKWKGQ